MDEKHLKNSVGKVETQFYTFGHPPEELELDCGRTLGPITIAYETYGTLNSEKSNAILITPGLTADAHAAGYYSKKDKYPGWWDGFIGPNKIFDTNKYFLICTNTLGGCMGSTGPSSIYPITGKPYGMLFPVISISDMVRAQKKLVESMGIKKLFAVTGGSMGGMQVLDYARIYPDQVTNIIPMCCTAHHTSQGIAFHEIGRQTIMADPSWNNGNYYDKKIPKYGLAIARMIAHITYLSEEKLEQRFGRQVVNSDIVRYDIDNQFQVESYLQYKGYTFVDRFDANAYIYLTRAVDLFDLAIDNNLKKGIEKIKARCLFITMSSDWLFPPAETKNLHDAFISAGKESYYEQIESIHGHDGFLLEFDKMAPILNKFLN